MTETICANFCRMHISISFRALYFKVSDYGSRMNVGSVSIPASGFSALIWHGLRPQVTPGPGHNTGHSRVQWPRVSRGSEESVPGHRSRSVGPGRSRSRALTPDPGHLVAVSPPGAGGGHCSPPPTQSSSVILCILLLLHLPCLQSRIALRSVIIGHSSRQHQETERHQPPGSAPRPRQLSGGWTVIRGVWRPLCVCYIRI